jgi:hypothetical protein
MKTIVLLIFKLLEIIFRGIMFLMFLLFMCPLCHIIILPFYTIYWLYRWSHQPSEISEIDKKYYHPKIYKNLFIDYWLATGGLNKNEEDSDFIILFNPFVIWDGFIFWEGYR